MSTPDSGFATALSALSDAGVAFVVVGVGGINFYARTPAEAHTTLDLDTLLEPTVENLRRALAALSSLGYRFESRGEPFVDLDHPEVLGGVVHNGATLSALHDASGEIDLMLSISGSSYAELRADAATFRVAGTEVRVGRLERLLRAKEISGRPKDVEFLRAYRAGREEE